MSLTIAAAEDAVQTVLEAAVATAATDLDGTVGVYNGVVPPDKLPEKDSDGPVVIFRLEETRGAESPSGQAEEFNADSKTYDLEVVIPIGRRRGSGELRALLEAVEGNGGIENNRTPTVGLHNRVLSITGVDCDRIKHVTTTTDHDQQVLIYFVQFTWTAHKGA